MELVELPSPCSCMCTRADFLQVDDAAWAAVWKDMVGWFHIFELDYTLLGW